MPSTYTLNNGIELIGTGEQSGTWGDTTNTNLGLLDAALDGQVTITLAAAGSSGSPNALPITDGTTSNGRNRMVVFADGGDLGATAYVQLTPNDAEKIIYIRNSLSGSRSVILFQGTYNASNDYEVPAGTTAVVYFDGAGAGAVAANVFNNAYFDGLRLGSVSVTAILDEDNMASDSATALATQQSIKAYVDAQVGTVDTLAEILAIGNTTGATDIAVDSAQKVQFRDAAIYINSSVDGQLDIVADTEIQIAATTVDLNGNLDVSGTTLVTGVLTTTAATVFNGGFASNADSTLGTDKKVQFRDAAIYINSSVDGQLDIVADTEIQIAATTVDLNGALDVSGTALVTGVLTTTATQVATGGITSGSSIISDTDSTDSLGSTGVRWLKGWFDTLTAGTLTIGSGSVTDSSGAISFGNENLTTTGIVTAAGTSVFTNLDISGDIDVDGTTNLDAVDIDGATQIDATVTVGVDDTGYDVKFFGATAGAYMLWDESADDLILGGAAGLSVNSTALVTGVLTTTAATVFNGGFAANAASTITTADNGVQLNLISTDSGSLNGPRFVMQRTGSAASSGDLLGRMEFYGSDDGGNATEYARIGVNAFDATGGSEDGAYFVSTRIDNVQTNRMYMPPSETVFNDESADVNFRVESDTNANALFVEGSSGNVGIGTSSPTQQLDVTATGATNPIIVAQNTTASNGGAQIRAGNPQNTLIMGTDSNGGGLTGTANASYFYTTSTSPIVFFPNATERMRINSTGGLITTPAAGGHAVFNEDGIDADFRVESDTNAFMLFVDAGNDRVGVGEGAPFTTLQVGARTGAGTTNPNTGSVLSVSKDGATGIDLGGNVNAGAVVGAINWVNYYGVGNYNTARIDTYAQGDSNSGELRFWTASVASSPTERMSIGPTGGLITTPAAGGDAVFNEGGVNADFRVESDANTHAIYVDAGNNSVTLGSSSSASNTIRTQSTAGFQASTDSNFETAKAYTFRDGVGIDNPNSSSFSTATAAVLCAGAMSTGRSINATGTINASGADYAEYEANNGLVISKGSIVGFKADGTLTLTFSEAVRFAVKSTDPAYVGGDTWSDVEPPEKNTTAWDTWFAEAEAKRAKVDRVAYSGKVPVNVQGATAGQYIIAVANSSGEITGQAVTDPDFSQYKLSVGRVNKILEDGRAELAVIIH
jgi:hypothetical protein